MKANKLLCTLVLSFFLGISANLAAKDAVPIRRGMTKQEVMQILGKPENTSFNQYGELWEFYKSGWPIRYGKRITVGFDINGKVVTYNSVTLRPDNETKNIKVENSNAPTIMPVPVYPSDGYCMSDQAFSVLYNKVKGASFDNNKFDLIEVASLGCYYSCCQCARIMKTFNFGDKKLKALRFMAPHIVDLQNADEIYRILDFESEKEQAARIIKGL